MLTIGSLFSGIGGLELGLERAGLGPVKWQVEIDPYCRAVLAKHWPDVERFDDVRTVGRGNLAPVDLICGGFPCQDISLAGGMAGISGSRSGLWSEYARIVGEIRPRYVVVENVAELARSGLDRVLADLASLGFDAVWFPLAAADLGAPHERDRLFVVAHPVQIGCSGAEQGGIDGGHETRLWNCGAGDAPCPSPSWEAEIGWAPEPALDRVANGVPNRMDRVGALGNAVVPQVAEVVGWVVRGIHERLTRCC